MNPSSNRQRQHPQRQPKRPLHLHNSRYSFYVEDSLSMGSTTCTDGDFDGIDDDRPHVPIRTAAPTPNRQSNNNNIMHCPRRRPPLILDAAQPQTQQSPHSLVLSSSSPSSSPYALSSSTKPNSQSTNCNIIANITLDESALTFARQAPLAGYLNKLDNSSSCDTITNNNLLPIIKRRFFVLQPATHLYYFLTAHDTAPRGCLDLHGARVERILNDKRERDAPKETVYRFALVWDEDEQQHQQQQETTTANHKNRIVLEARSQEEADHWIQALEEQRLSHSQEALRKAQLHQSAQRSRILELEQQLAHFKHVETEKGLAEQEALQWQRQFERLDEGIRKLTRQLLRRPSRSMTKQKSSTVQDEKKQEEEEEEDENRVETQDSTENHLPDDEDNNSDDDSSNNDSDIRHVPGSTYFAGLVNTVEQLRENLRLASDEAATAVEDVVTAQTQLQAIQARMTMAEQHLLKIWEENCALRKQLKQKKREKRVLVREVKNLRQAARAVSRDLMRQSMESMQANDNQINNNNSDEEMDDDNHHHHDNSRNGEEIGELDDDEDAEDKLIHDLEEHVQSSLRLHEQFMATNGEIQARLGGASHLAASLDVSIDQDLRQLLDSTLQLASTGKKMKRRSSSPKIHPNVPLFENTAKSQDPLPVASLFDNSEEDDDDHDDESDSVVSSVRAQASDTDPIAIVERTNPNLVDDSSVDDCSSERPNPVLQLDEEIGRSETQAPRLCATSSQSESSSGVASARQATSKLACPLADVVSTHHYGPCEAMSSNNCKSQHHNPDDLTVYHLTFYSRRIGLQFQKVPPPPTKPRGLLTDALTADLANVSSANEKTAAELRRIAAISTRGKSSDPKKGIPAEQTTCDVASPVDAVLVCGFEGFDDDSGNNERPKLGARLVAFDGVSIEVGWWTFESVRKSIQARGRPLTLSFRNDFLTTEQRRILTKAVQDMQQTSPSSLLPPLPATSSSVSHGSGAHSDDLSASGASGSDFLSPGGVLILPQSFSGANSRNSSSHYNYHHGRSSFSEVQSTTSSSVLSAVAPLVSNLLSSNSNGSSNSFRRSRGPFTPEYLKRAPTSVEETPQHQDFQSELL